jgi:hypothetical protein
MGGIYRSEWAPPLIWCGNSPSPGQPTTQLSLHRLWASNTLCINPPWHVGKAEIEKATIPGQPAKEVGPVGPALARLGLGFVPCHPLMSHYLWLSLILDILKICMDFGPYDAFPSSDVSEMVDQQNLWNSLVISTCLLYLVWNIGMLVINICILWLPIASRHSPLSLPRLSRRWPALHPFSRHRPNLSHRWPSSSSLAPGQQPPPPCGRVLIWTVGSNWLE